MTTRRARWPDVPATRYGPATFRQRHTSRSPSTESPIALSVGMRFNLLSLPGLQEILHDIHDHGEIKTKRGSHIARIGHGMVLEVCLDLLLLAGKLDEPAHTHPRRPFPHSQEEDFLAFGLLPIVRSRTIAVSILETDKYRAQLA